jgi:hypothetical protein
MVALVERMRSVCGRYKGSNAWEGRIAGVEVSRMAGAW